MVISNAQPIKFWLEGEETFNEKQVCGITPVCFCQPFHCDDPIAFQFKDLTTRQYILRILNAFGGLITSIPFDLVSTSGAYSVFFLSITPSALSICDQQVSFEIVYETIGEAGNVYFYEPAEDEPVHFYEPGEDNPVYLFEPSEL